MCPGFPDDKKTGGVAKGRGVLRPPIPSDPALAKHRLVIALGDARAIPTVFGGEAGLKTTEGAEAGQRRTSATVF